MTCLLDWLTKYEDVAVWIEGLALIGIFGFDIRVARRDHQETLEQLRIAQDQIKISQNAERAWIMATLEWFEHGRQHVMYDTQGGNPGEGELETTEVTLKFKLCERGQKPSVHGLVMPLFLCFSHSRLYFPSPLRAGGT